MLRIPTSALYRVCSVLKQRILAVRHYFHRLLVAAKLLTAKRHSRYVKESESRNFGKVGVGHFTSDSTTLLGCRFDVISSIPALSRRNRVIKKSPKRFLVKLGRFRDLGNITINRASNMSPRQVMQRRA